jgi:hypothetical protein
MELILLTSRVLLPCMIVTAFLLGLLLYPEYGGFMFLLKSLNLYHTIRRHVPEDKNIHQIWAKIYQAEITVFGVSNKFEQLRIHRYY